MYLIYLSPVPWDSFSQRPHEFVRYFHESTGGQVLWLDPYPARFPNLSDILKSRPHVSCEGDRPEWLSVVKVRALPIEPLPFSHLINGLFWREIYEKIACFPTSETILAVGKPTVLAMSVLKRGGFARSIYDVMDDFPSFFNGLSRRLMLYREGKILERVSRILASSSSLYRRFSPQFKDVRKVLNGCATERLPWPTRTPDQFDSSRKVLGYVGTIASWFDWGMVKAIAEIVPEVHIRLIGPVYVDPPFRLPPNITLEPPVPHAKAIETMLEFDVGLIPFKQNRLTASVDPIKYYEYRALGLPVISTSFGEMSYRKKRNGVYLMGESSDVRKLVFDAIGDCMPVSRIEEFRAENSWRVRFVRADVFGV